MDQHSSSRICTVDKLCWNGQARPVAYKNNVCAVFSPFRRIPETPMVICANLLVVTGLRFKSSIQEVYDTGLLFDATVKATSRIKSRALA